MEQSFFQKNKVLIIGLMSAIAVAITPFAQTGEQTEGVKWATVGYAALIAILSFLGNAWRGQGLTIFGLAGTAMATAGTLLTQGSSLDTQTFIMQLVIQTFIAVAMAAGSDPKSKGYEKSPMIMEAKKEGEAISPASLTNKPKE